ncbi:MAG: GTP-binding protein [Pseudomonadota bacterium]
MTSTANFTATLEVLRAKGKRALAEALVRIETDLDNPGIISLLDEAHRAPKGFSLGVTGPPGVGKSTLLNALIQTWRASGRTVGVIAIDPSSMRTGGALLGDRTRLTTDPTDDGVFVRSMAARSKLGGVAEETFPAMVLMRAIYDLVIVETVGVGQSETGISAITDLTMFCAQPGSGDSLQYMKAGIMEIPDLIAVTKSDMGNIARRTASDLRGGLSLTSGDTLPEVVLCSATNRDGIDDLLQMICTIATRNRSRFEALRNEKLIRWSEDRITSRFGTHGVELALKLCGKLSTGFSFCDGFTRLECLVDTFTEANL